MDISFLDLHKQYKSIKSEVDGAIKRVVSSQSFVLGSELKTFESKFAKYLKVGYVLGVNSGTDGLILALLSLGIGKNDEIITPANSFIATTNAIIQVGAKPVLVDCDPDTYQIDVKKVKDAITKKTKVILPVHLYGAPSDIDKLQRMAKRNRLYVIEDACQAHGATFNNKKLGTFGDLGVFSFYPSKNLGAYGDGGAVVTNNKKLYEKLIKLRNHGQVKKYYHDSFGVNSRLDEVQAAVLNVKLKHLDKWNTKRNNVADNYKKLIKNYKIQRVIKNGKSSYHIFVIESENRNKLQKHLFKKGIHTLIHYPVPIHLQRAYKYLGYRKGSFPIAENISDKIISIPMYPELTEKEVGYIATSINLFK